MCIFIFPFPNFHCGIIFQNTFPGTPEKFFTLILGDNPIFIQQYRDARKDTDLKVCTFLIALSTRPSHYLDIFTQLTADSINI